MTDCSVKCKYIYPFHTGATEAVYIKVLHDKQLPCK